MRKEGRTLSLRERFNIAIRRVDENEWQTRQQIRQDADNLLSKPNVTSVELVSEVVFIIGQRALKWPIALIAGADEFFRRR